MYDKLGQTALKGKGDKLWYNCSLKDEIENKKSYFYCYLYKSNMDQRDIMKEERIQKQTKSFLSERSLVLEFFL